MKPGTWMPPVVFLVTSIPTVWLLNVFNVAADFRIWIALAVGAIATAFTQSRLKANELALQQQQQEKKQ